VYIDGAPFDRRAWSPFFMPARVRVRFGRLVDVSDFCGREREDEVVRYLLSCVLAEIARLAGREEFQPKFAGREWRPSDEEVEAHRAESIAARKKRRK
jgi:hypothetical protein